jgi:hypothetical protein
LRGVNSRLNSTPLILIVLIVMIWFVIGSSASSKEYRKRTGMSRDLRGSPRDRTESSVIFRRTPRSMLQVLNEGDAPRTRIRPPPPVLAGTKPSTRISCPYQASRPRSLRRSRTPRCRAQSWQQARRRSARGTRSSTIFCPVLCSWVYLSDVVRVPNIVGEAQPRC